MLSHRAVRPTWDCGTCGRPWPCDARRAQLSEEFADARVSLILLLSAYFEHACQDLPDAPAGSLYNRFIGWARA
jgi:hypothetical protein